MNVEPQRGPGRLGGAKRAYEKLGPAGYVAVKRGRNRTKTNVSLVAGLD